MKSHSVLLSIVLLATAHASTAPDRVSQAEQALEALVADADGSKPLSQGDADRCIRTVRDVAGRLPPNDARVLPRLAALREKHAADLAPKPKRPLKRDNALGRLLMAFDIDRLNRLPPEEVQAHPASSAFPGAVPTDAPRVPRMLEIDTVVPDWHSTGLYAAPGEVVTVTVPASAADKGLRVRIGAHSDRLWHLEAWMRAPDICLSRPLAEPVTRLASAFGGLVYVDVPRDCPIGAVKVSVAGAVEAPFYIHGQTDLAAWRNTIRTRAAPWAELASKKIILTLPSAVVRDLDDPDAVMTFWDAVADACADLAARPHVRPERFVTDVQISAGYMHAGYPLMTLLDMPPVMVDVPRLKRNGHDGVWGLFHELGHNHQEPDWTFRGTGEVTVNLFTMHVLETVCGLEPTQCHGSISDRSRANAMRKYFADPDFSAWQRDPFLALIMYIQIQKAFGWEPFKKVFAEYRTLTPDERPRSDEDKRDQWLVRFSRAVGRNLGPFFEAWHIPTSEAARKQIAGLPAWMPEGFPPKG